MVLAAALGAAAMVGAFARSADAADDLALRRVLLSSGGVGYFEYAARVTGTADLALDVRLDQVDDVLKSVVVYDDRGRAGAISLPSRTAPSDVFRDVPFDEEALASEPALLTALRGAEVRIEIGDETISGRVMSVTTEEVPSDHTNVTRHRLAILTGAGVRTVILEEVQRLAFVDPELQRQLDAALASLLDRRERGRRTLTVHSEGEGEREVRVAYVVAVPLWKSTYRLVLPADPAAKQARLEGWAVIENQSGRAWSDVDLTLVSGNPVTFRQALYESYYVQRPEIPVEVVGRVLPRIDEGAVAVITAHRDKGVAFAGAAGGEAMPSAAPFAPPAPPELAPTTSAAPIEAATQVIFHLPEAVNVASGTTELVPIVDRLLTAERVALYQPETSPTNPLAAVRLVNETASGLPPGVVTIYDRSGPDGAITYAGDARLSTLPAGDSRMLAYGVDTKVRIDKRESSSKPITVATISGGVLRMKRLDRRTTTYTVKGAAREPRTVILEHPRVAGFEIEDHESELIGVDEAHYRLRVEVPAGATVPFTVTLARPLDETVRIADLPANVLGAYASSSDLPPALREAMRRLATLRATVDDKAKDVADLEAERARITADEARVRENLKVIPVGSSLHERSLADLAAAEEKLKELGTKLDAARAALNRAKRALAEAVQRIEA
jgi:hypothetical protein